VLKPPPLIVVFIGIVAIAGMLGALTALPQPFGFYLVAISSLVFPGLAVWLIRQPGNDSSIEGASIFLALGLCLWLLVSMVGLMLKLRLVWVIVGMLLITGGLVLGVVIEVVRVGDSGLPGVHLASCHLP